MARKIYLCGDANPNGNVLLTYKGGCRKPVKISEAYRCTGCGGRFHLDCILKHFELEKEHDVGRAGLKKEIIDWVIKNHDHHTGKKCVDHDYPFVNSLALEKHIKSL